MKKVLIVIVCAVFLIGLAGTLLLYLSPGKSVIEIVQDEKVLYTIDLRTVTEPRDIVITCESGENTVHVEKDCVYVSSADCPDLTCVRMGELRGGASIVCLPHKLVIRYAASGGPDAVSE